MKKLNVAVMSLLATAAFTFNSCNTDDALTPGSGTSNQEAFLKTQIVSSGESEGTKTAQENEFNAIAGEHEVNSGTLYITDADKNIVFQKTLTTADWEKAKVPSESSAGRTTLEIPVKYVTFGVTYNVYFLANTTDAAPWNGTYTATTKFTGEYGKPNQFAMFNQNDATVAADAYKVTFTEANKGKENAATIQGGKAIKVERIAARIDQPTSEAVKLVDYKELMTPDKIRDLTDKQKAIMDNAIERVESILLSRYAIANAAKSTYIMQHWGDNFSSFNTHATAWWQPYGEFGTTTRKDNDAYFKAIASTTEGKQANFEYVFENNVAGTDNATSMYLEYTINLKDVAGTHKDFTDGTFYRFANKIYTSIEDILKAYENQSNPFGATNTKDVLLAELKIVDGKTTATEAELAKFRTDHAIEIFVGGKAYYKTTIDDKFLSYTGRHLIQRNSVYQLNIKNVYNVGADVPNGDPTTVDPMYYLNVEVTVNPWVLNTIDVDLK